MNTPEFWNEKWKNEQWANRESGNARECWEAWKDIESARLYAEGAKKNAYQGERFSYLASFCHQNSRVLDIGAGPGTFAVPLSPLVSHITAVEPAHGMGVVFDEYIQEAGVQNIDIIPKRWDDVKIATDIDGSYDLVFCSFAFGMLDLLDSIQKMISVAEKTIVLYWHAGDQAWDVDAQVLWPLLHDKAFTPIPKSNIIFNLLYSMGIYPDITSYTNTIRASFSSFDEALDDYQKRFKVSPLDREKNKKLIHYLDKTLCRNGDCLLQGSASNGMRITIPLERVPEKWRTYYNKDF